ncbi:DUF2254 domain-containing protein [Phocoenobacter skyensis]|uniref:Uncharacterized membrane protein n=1 Tax=Phocoenobacter skyensis TaxID=97481 RepID=A0A1H7W1K1_9PAST|nr:DUF2254 domain-containing protein [Pasteurella skyensis]MDP8184962.1 DUF2254 domain-containing protein [Pasteurella skyensis]QLB21794.1 hypothetical protein A6B44_00600 [Pasteurella skyensis]SEM14979.1 Uncharacterized membrane protein [Pasteurella skyensis]
MYRFLLWLKQPSNTLWVKPTLGALLALIIAFSSYWIDRWLPAQTLPKINIDIVDDLLNIIASSMLAVSTFSLSIMIAAFSSVASNATPRATELIIADGTTRTAISSFLSAFIYAVIAKILLGLGIFGTNGLFILFGCIVILLLYLVVVLIRWVQTLSGLGRLKNTLDRIQQKATESLHYYRNNPNLGTAAKITDLKQVRSIYSQKIGYLININLSGLQHWAEDNDCSLHIMVRVGNWLMPNKAMVLVQRDHFQDIDFDEINRFFIVDSQRKFEQDPSFGLSVLSEVAQRALSPAINDSGTALTVLATLAQLLIERPIEKEDDRYFDRLSIVPLDEGIFIEESIAPIARDGATNINIGIAILKTLATIYHQAPTVELSLAAQKEAENTLQRSIEILSFENDKRLISDVYQQLFGYKLSQ